LVTLVRKNFIAPTLSRSNDTQNPCFLELAPVVVEGCKRSQDENRSDFYFEVQVDGPGYVFGSRTVGLDRASQSALLQIPLELLLNRSSTNVESQILTARFKPCVIRPENRVLKNHLPTLSDGRADADRNSGFFFLRSPGVAPAIASSCGAV